MNTQRTGGRGDWVVNRGAYSSFSPQGLCIVVLQQCHSVAWVSVSLGTPHVKNIYTHSRVQYSV